MTICYHTHDVCWIYTYDVWICWSFFVVTALQNCEYSLQNSLSITHSRSHHLCVFSSFICLSNTIFLVAVPFILLSPSLSVVSTLNLSHCLSFLHVCVLPNHSVRLWYAPGLLIILLFDFLSAGFRLTFASCIFAEHLMTSSYNNFLIIYLSNLVASLCFMKGWPSQVFLLSVSCLPTSSYLSLVFPPVPICLLSSYLFLCVSCVPTSFLSVSCLPSGVGKPAGVPSFMALSGLEDWNL